MVSRHTAQAAGQAVHRNPYAKHHQQPFLRVSFRVRFRPTRIPLEQGEPRSHQEVPEVRHTTVHRTLREDQEAHRTLELRRHIEVRRMPVRRTLHRCALDDVVLHLDSRP